MKVCLVGQLAVLSALLVSAPATARGYTCNVPRAMLCEGCARDIVITLTPTGACRISFTPGDGASATGGALPLRFEVQAPRARPWRPRVARAAPATAATPVGPRCFSFNGNQYCE